MANKKLAEVAGWYGMVAILISFSLISFGIFEATSVWYQVLNLTGAVGIAWNAYEQRAHPSVILNIIYGVVAAVALTRLIFN